MSMASFCRPEACGVTPSATLAPSQRWLLCPAGHTHCLALSSYTTPKQTADHPQRCKKDEEVVQRSPLKSNFLILVTSSISLRPSFPSLSIHALMLQPLKCKCWHPWAHSRRLLMCQPSYHLNRSSSVRAGVDQTLHCLHNQPQMGAQHYLCIEYLSGLTNTLRFLVLHSPHVNLLLTCICSQPWPNKQKKRPPNLLRVTFTALPWFINRVCVCVRTTCCTILTMLNI